jgi:hypothetical protein
VGGARPGARPDTAPARAARVPLALVEHVVAALPPALLGKGHCAPWAQGTRWAEVTPEELGGD